MRNIDKNKANENKVDEMAELVIKSSRLLFLYI